MHSPPFMTSRYVYFSGIIYQCPICSARTHDYHTGPHKLQLIQQRQTARSPVAIYVFCTSSSIASAITSTAKGDQSRCLITSAVQVVPYSQSSSYFRGIFHVNTKHLTYDQIICFSYFFIYMEYLPL